MCERFLGSLRRECLDHVLILGESQLSAVLGQYAQYFNRSRPHQGIGQSIPAAGHTIAARPDGDINEVVSSPVLGGLHHDYRLAA